MKIVHFFFLEIGLGRLQDHPMYLKNIDIMKTYNPKTKMIIWDEPKLDKLVKQHYPHLLSIWNQFPTPFYKIDFGRYLVLKRYGGMYLDLDMECVRPLPPDNEMDFINIYRDEKGKETFNNNVIYFRDSSMYDKIIDFSIHRIKTHKMPDTWKKRILLHTVGARMYHKCCKNNHYHKTNVNMYFKDHQTKSWLKVDV